MTEATQGHILQGSIYMKCPEQTNVQTQKIAWRLPTAQADGKKQVMTAKEGRVWGSDKNILNLITVMVAQSVNIQKDIKSYTLSA